MTHAVSVSHMTVRFGDFTAVNDVSFRVEKGSIFAFLGPNGAGKSTTIKVLTTLLKPSEGEATVAGHHVEKDSLMVRKSFGICFQDQSLDDDLTAYENMQFHAMLYSVPKKVREHKIEELLTLVELTDRKNDFVRNFSGGMKRRLEIARALLHEPKILFLDEPTLGLDPQTRNHIWNYIQNLNKKTGMTIFFTTHYMEEAERFADRVTVIDHGTIIQEGTVNELLKATHTERLEDAFIALTGKDLRKESSDSVASLRMRSKGWGR
jgi:ABC-2 type transport system ATP-binding protein